MNLEDEIVDVVVEARERLLREIPDSPALDALAQAIKAYSDAVLEGVKVLARRVEALEGTQEG